MFGLDKTAVSDNAKRKAKILLPWLDRSKTVLDFGCGDQQMAYQLRKLNKLLRITGIDVADFGHRYQDIGFTKFDGQKIPYPAKSFDAVIAYHVFHHTSNPVGLFGQCCKIAKRRIIFVEPVYRSYLEIPGMMIMDWLFNVWKDKQISMTYKFCSQIFWLSQIADHNLQLRNLTDVDILPKFLPTGRSMLFVVDKQ